MMFSPILLHFWAGRVTSLGWLLRHNKDFDCTIHKQVLSCRTSTKFSFSPIPAVHGSDMTLYSQKQSIPWPNREAKCSCFQGSSKIGTARKLYLKLKNINAISEAATASTECQCASLTKCQKAHETHLKLIERNFTD